MTWADLRAVLDSHSGAGRRGLVRAVHPPTPDVTPGAVTGIAYDSRAVAAGQVFVALKGQHADGTAFAREAVARGAVAIVSQEARPADMAVAWIVVEDARLALALLAAAFFRHPSADMRVIGITGTNGKTTT
ncbi:MAG: Mur ligase domain-containing protein, partial [Vicinamibacterales bacterium]